MDRLFDPCPHPKNYLIDDQKVMGIDQTVRSMPTTFLFIGIIIRSFDEQNVLGIV